MNMTLPKRISWPIFFFLIYLSFFSPPKVKAWSGEVHNYLCPESVINAHGNCNVADSWEFKKTYPFAESYHLCLDNKTDCPARLIAKYYLKKYYLEGKSDPNLIGAAAHLIQDSYCPDHWYPMREYPGGKIFVPFAPNWLTKTEPWVSMQLSQKKQDWNYPISFQGKTININQTYLAEVKQKVAQFVSQEPAEDLSTLESQIKSRNFANNIRGYREVAFVALLLLLPILGWIIWQLLVKRGGKIDFIIVASSCSLLILFITLSYVLY